MNRLLRSANFRIAVGAERIMDDNGDFHWQSTLKLTADREEAKEMRQPFFLPQRQRMTEKETPQEYEEVFRANGRTACGFFCSSCPRPGERLRCCGSRAVSKRLRALSGVRGSAETTRISITRSRA